MNSCKSDGSHILNAAWACALLVAGLVGASPAPGAEIASMTSEPAGPGAPTLAEATGRLRPLAKPLQAIASSYVAVPASANVQGAFGAFFRTRVSVLNVTQFSIAVTAYLLTPQSGPAANRTFSVGAGQTVTYGNALQDLFGYTGGGGLVFISQSGSQEFIITSEVYVDGPNGRFSTAVEAQNILDSIGIFADLTVGLLVDSANRANVGCMNDDSSSTTARARIYDASGAGVGTVTFTLPPYTWVQGPVSFNVNRGSILWDSTGASAFCYAVNVNNTSNDGTFLGRTTFVP